MPRLMSFAMTKFQVYARQKTVTRRLGWAFLKPGDILWAVEKAQGIPKGGKVKRICKIRVLDVREEALCAITEEEVAREGFPGMSDLLFVSLFCKANRCRPSQLVRRIEFEYLDEGGDDA